MALLVRTLLEPFFKVFLLEKTHCSMFKTSKLLTTDTIEKITVEILSYSDYILMRLLLFIRAYFDYHRDNWNFFGRAFQLYLSGIFLWYYEEWLTAVLVVLHLIYCF